MAGGAGRRMGGAMPKQFMMLGNMPVLARTINLMREALPAAQIVVVLPEAHMELWRNLAARFDVAPHKTAEAANGSTPCATDSRPSTARCVT